jgi:hypothetical protein
MSFNNRLLFNRAAVNPRESLEVMLAAQPGATAAVTQLAESLGGRVGYVDADVGYVRAEVPRSRLAELVDHPAVASYQISSMSHMAWYDDAPSEQRERMYRGYEARGLDPLNLTDLAREVPSDLHALTAEEASRPGYTAAEDVALEQWFAEHPTYDGRGVTIAMMEGANLDFGHPAFRRAKTLDGRDVPKFAGILNTVSPTGPDVTRVGMERVIRPTTTWQPVDGRTYLVPRPGTFRFGVFSLRMGDNVTQSFPLLWDEAAGDVWMDTNGDTSFQDERPMRDFNERFDIRQLRITSSTVHPDFVITTDARAAAVHVYVGRNAHATMTASVAAGSRSGESLAFGVAPGARVLAVASSTGTQNAHTFVEAYLETARRPDVDLLYDEYVLETVPDTDADFLGIIFSRIVSVRGTPIVNAAGNDPPLLGMVQSYGEDVLSVGGTIGPASFAALFGGGVLGSTTVPTSSAGGPLMDGSLKPDFLAPMYRIAAEPRSLARRSERGLPSNSPTRWRPHGYVVSCCTSASSPYAAGVAALLISAAKQEGIPYTAESLYHALRRGATLLPGVPLYRQGNGVLNVPAAWAHLKGGAAPVRLRVRAPVRHALSGYLTHRGEGPGLLEREGWTKGQTGTRTLRLTRETGPAVEAPYPLSWTGSDGTFASRPEIELPLGREVELPVRIRVRESGIHAAYLNVHDPDSRSIVSRIVATVVAGEALGQDGRWSVPLRGVVPLMGTREHVVSVPPGTAALRLDVAVDAGRIGLLMMAPDGRHPIRYSHITPSETGRPVGKGRYTHLLPDPAPGTWSLGFRNDARTSGDPPQPPVDGAGYSLTATVFSGSITGSLKTPDEIDYRAESTAARLSAPAILVSRGRLRTRSAEYMPSGEPVLEEVDVPANAETLVVKATASPGSSPLELHLYKCVTGYCFAYDHTLPARSEQALRVKRPDAGRWVVAVNAAPALVGTGGFILETLVTGASVRHPLPAGTQRWAGSIPAPPPQAGQEAVLLELIDVSLKEVERSQPLATPETLAKLQNRPVAIATVVVKP